jgi:hypothetical protein
MPEHLCFDCALEGRQTCWFLRQYNNIILTLPDSPGYEDLLRAGTAIFDLRETARRRTCRYVNTIYPLPGQEKT